ncbi:hypothetical protein [Pontimicrobium aquaticum]|uniref:Uncharacterized protein n=1 Tax=Pontimicrobium aquaticum TaxID=2565367 RepID=A0A4U0EVQ6_9FLAO|nr:hypothetical protein [Pontimicrobium aquaticum]TJY36001.1 hypothetical protein E5167_09065 [Pontimicrobium aquaticum]
MTKIFLNEYYFGYGIPYMILRLSAGPLILIMGINQYTNGNTKAGIGYAGFMIFFGVYYMLKPFIVLLYLKSWYNNFDVEVSIQADKLLLQKGKIKSEVDYSEIDKAHKRKAYYKLSLSSKQELYLPTKNLETSELKILENLIL